MHPGLRRRRRQLTAVAGILLALLFLPQSWLLKGLMPWKHLWRSLHPEAPFTVYVVGESTAWGEPYAPKISFARIVSEMYGNRVRGRPLEVVNLAQPGGITEDAYWRLFKTLALQPGEGILLVYSGINDNTLERKDPDFPRWRALHRLALPARLQYLCSAPRVQRWLGTEQNSQQKFETHLSGIVRLGQAYDLPVVVSTLVGNLREFGPERIEGNAIHLQPWDMKRLNMALALEESGEAEQAAALFKALLDGHCGVLRGPLNYRLARCLDRIGRGEEAREFYWRATEETVCQVPNRSRNRAIRRTCARTGAVLVDAEKVFTENSPQGLIGYNLFIDAHHPNLDGYLLLAEAFADGMTRALGEAPRQRFRNVQELRDRFEFDDADLAQAYFSRSAWILYYLTTSGDDLGSRAARMDEYLTLALELNPKVAPEERIAFLRFAAAAMNHRPDEALAWRDRWLSAPFHPVGYERAWLVAHPEFLQGLPSEKENWLREALTGPDLAPRGRR